MYCHDVTREIPVFSWLAFVEVSSIPIRGSHVDGGYFIGRPMYPKSRPAKTKKAKAESRAKSHGLGWAGDKPTKARVEKESAREES